MSARPQSFPVDTVLEGSGGAVYRLLVEGFGDQHHADRQAVDHPARQAHGRLMRAVELRSVGQHLEAALQDVRDRPKGLAAGLYDSISVHSASVTSLAYRLSLSLILPPSDFAAHLVPR